MSISTESESPAVSTSMTSSIDHRPNISPLVSRQVLVMRYVVAVLAVIAAISLTYGVDTLRNKQSFLPVTAAVTIAAWYGGLGPSLLAIVLAAFSWAWVIAPPVSTIALANPSDVFRLVLFVLVALLISSLHNARSKAEAALKEAQHRLSLALDAVQMGVWDYDIRKKTFWLSTRMKTMLHCEEEETNRTYSSFLAHVFPADRPGVVQAMTCTLEDRAEYEVEHRIVLPDNAIRWVKTRGRTFVNARNEVERIVGVAIDITDQKAAAGGQS